ncbi:hypothetical protein DBR43_09845 [Pedobacter sp. KBW06]|uniref:SusC/RagA family TonB-linked outer membrane protein n=1 Tax=Pedobacter sp. KBW06 TaxID=2153359 RepID=UPI000F5AD140|nr:SusC/RagA family TonB-linked outer membrane protein [Pedobacter sp. KBW06]RQO75630.1 hypothetical protein DBR43_09845 [Pedobacter sp. KBW06]
MKINEKNEPDRHNSNLLSTPKIMRLFMLLVAIFLTLTFEVAAAQITLNERQSPLKKILKSISIQSGYDFIYSDIAFENLAPINVKLEHVSLEIALKTCLENQPLIYMIEDKTVMVRRKSKENSSFLRSVVAILTEIDVHCKVVDEKGIPLVGANIRVKGGGKSASTDNKGEFSLQKIDEQSELLISYVGYKTKDIQVKELLKIKELRMEPLSGELKEVEVNTGYQKVKRGQMTGSFDYIDNKALEQTPGPDILNRIKNISSGIVFEKSSVFGDDKSARQSIKIRGASSFSYGLYSPLIILDNFPYEGNIYNINPNDIESVTVLKDAAAAAIWGAKAGNGVIVITSKKGAYLQATQVSAGVDIDVSQKPDLFEWPRMSISDYIEKERFLFNKGVFDLFIGDSGTYNSLTPAIQALVDHKKGKINDSDLETRLNELSKNDIRDDLSKYRFQKEVAQRYHINVSGGSEQQNYFVSAGWDKNLYRTKGDSYNRLTLKANYNYSFFNRLLEINTAISYALNHKNSLPFDAFTPNSASSALYPYVRLKEEDGSNAIVNSLYKKAFLDKWNEKLLDWNYRPLDEIGKVKDISITKDYQFSLGAKINFSKQLNVNLNTVLGSGNTLNQKEYDQDSFYARDLINTFSQIDPVTGSVKRVIPFGGILRNSNNDYNSKNFRAQLNYNNDWIDGHQLNFIAGAELLQKKTGGYTNTFAGYDPIHETSNSIDPINYYPTILGGTRRIPFDATSLLAVTSQRNISFYSAMTYSYQNKYVIFGSVRNDAANIFGVKTNQKWLPLWSVGLNWNLSKEAFYRINWLPELKVKTSFGYTGNVRTDLTAYLVTSDLGQNSLFREPSSGIRNFPNPELRWEKVGMFNAGVNFSTERNRISGGIEWFYKNMVDLIQPVVLPPVVGVSGNSPNLNSGKIKGQGWDLQLRSENLRGNFSWTSSLNLSYTTNIVSSTTDPLNSNSDYVRGRFVEGRPLQGFYSYKWAGLDSQTGDPIGYLKESFSKDYAKIASTLDPGSLIYHGSAVPVVTGNLMNAFSYKGFEFSFNLSGKFGYYFRRNSIDYYSLLSNGGSGMGEIDFALRWQKIGDEKQTNVPSMVFPADYSRALFYKNSEILVEKADHIRLQDLRLNYSFLRSRFPHLPFRNVNLFFHIANLGVIWSSNRRGIDPDEKLFASFGGSFVRPKTISFGFKLTI